MANVSDPAIKEAYENVRKGTITWLLLGYAEGNNIAVEATGTGDIDELVSHLKDNACQYGYAKVVFTADESTRTKFVFISWIGASASPLKKGKVSVHKANIKELIKDFTVEVQGEDKEDLSHEKILEKVKKANY